MSTEQERIGAAEKRHERDWAMQFWRINPPFQRLKYTYILQNFEGMDLRMEELS